MWCIRDITPEYKERMYDILDLYEEPYDPARPVIGLDEKPKQLLGEKRESIPLRPGKIEKYDYEYIRQGNANIFMSVEPKGGKRFPMVTRRRTKRDFAHYLQSLSKRYRKATLIRVVLDNLNTHKLDSLCAAFGYEKAQTILNKFEFHYTPKHASWLNVAEIEIGIMDAACTAKRISNIESLTCEVNAWAERRNKAKKMIKWTFTKQKADSKLGKYYVS
jgi:hypothetical protein